MSNFPTVIDPSDLSTQLSQSAVQQTSQAAGVSFLKMDFESGDWLLGQDQDVVTDEEVLVNTASFKHGWILWSGGRPNKNMVGFTFDLPMPMENVGDDYPSEARSFDGALFDDGTPLVFDTSSYGGRKGADSLLGAVKSHSAEGSEHLYPLVKLTSESYANSKRGGKLTYNPVFEIIAWCDQEGNKEGPKAAQVEDQSEAAEEPAEEAQPKRQRRKRNAA